MADLLQPTAGEHRGVYISGGGVGSRLGLKLRSALAGRELHLMLCPEAVCLGTAILAGVAATKYASFAQAVEQVVHVAETIMPDVAIAHTYKAQMEQYRILYSSLTPLRRAQTTGD
jgi:xylulokinase